MENEELSEFVKDEWNDDWYGEDLPGGTDGEDQEIFTVTDEQQDEAGKTATPGDDFHRQKRLPCDVDLIEVFAGRVALLRARRT